MRGAKHRLAPFVLSTVGNTEVWLRRLQYHALTVGEEPLGFYAPPDPAHDPDGSRLADWERDDADLRALIRDFTDPVFHGLYVAGMSAQQWVAAIEAHVVDASQRRAPQILDRFYRLSLRNSLPKYFDAVRSSVYEMKLLGQLHAVQGPDFATKVVFGLAGEPKEKTPLNHMFKHYILEWRVRPQADRPQDFESLAEDITRWKEFVETYGLVPNVESASSDAKQAAAAPRRKQPASSRGSCAPAVCYGCGEAGHIRKDCLAGGDDGGGRRSDGGGRRSDSGSVAGGGGGGGGAQSGGGGRGDSCKSPRLGDNGPAHSVGIGPNCAVRVKGLVKGSVVVSTAAQAGHFLNSADWFEELHACKRRVQFGAARPILVKQSGPARMLTNKGWLHLSNAFFVPSMPYNILSTESLKDDGVVWGKQPGADVIDFYDASKRLRDPAVKPLFTASKDRGNSDLYVLLPLAEVQGGAARGRGPQ